MNTNFKDLLLQNFINKNDLKEYENWIKPLKSLQIRIISFITGLLYILYFIIDMQIASGRLLDIMEVFHLYINPGILFLISALTFWDKYFKQVIILLIIAPIIAAAANLLIVFNSIEPNFYLTELYLIIFWTFSISGLKLKHSLISIFFIVSISTYLLYQLDEKLFIMHCFWMTSVISFGLVSAYLIESSSKIVFFKSRDLEKLAITDKLTGLYNRRKFDEVVESEIQVCKRFDNIFGIILIDIDYFKEVNDTKGHHCGDIFLKEISQLIKENIRSIDLSFRWGGEEFIILCRQKDKENVITLAQKLRKKVEETNFTNIGRKTISIGITTLNKEDNIDTLIQRVDKALYAAKQNGRNRVEVQ